MTQSDRPEVVIVDSQPGFREAARELLESRGYHVIAEADRASTAVHAVERHEPDAVLLEVRLGDDDGFAVCRKLTRTRPDLAVLLASDGDHEHLHELIESCGARGFVRKSRLGQVDLGRYWPAP